jgi:hypothetical protein
MMHEDKGQKNDHGGGDFNLTRPGLYCLGISKISVE